MRDLAKLAMAGIAGYLIGFYEMKYKMLKVYVENEVNKKEKKGKEGSE